MGYGGDALLISKIIGLAEKAKSTLRPLLIFKQSSLRIFDAISKEVHRGNSYYDCDEIAAGKMAHRIIISSLDIYLKLKNIYTYKYSLPKDCGSVMES